MPSTIFKMATVRHLGIVLPPYETTHEVCCWPQLPVKFHVNLIHRSKNIAIWIFRIFGLKCLFRPKNGGFGGLWTPKCDYSSSGLQRGTSLRKSASFKLSTVKIRWGVWPVGELTESVTDTQSHTHTHTGKFIFCPCIALDRQKRKIGKYVTMMRCYGDDENVDTRYKIALKSVAQYRHQLDTLFTAGCKRSGWSCRERDASSLVASEAACKLKPKLLLITLLCKLHGCRGI